MSTVVVEEKLLDVSKLTFSSREGLCAQGKSLPNSESDLRNAEANSFYSNPNYKLCINVPQSPRTITDYNPNLSESLRKLCLAMDLGIDALQFYYSKNSRQRLEASRGLKSAEDFLKSQAIAYHKQVAPLKIGNKGELEVSLVLTKPFKALIKSVKTPDQNPSLVFDIKKGD